MQNFVRCIKLLTVFNKTENNNLIIFLTPLFAFLGEKCNLSLFHYENNLTVDIIFYRKTLTLGKKVLNPIYQKTKDGNNTKNILK